MTYAKHSLLGMTAIAAALAFATPALAQDATSVTPDVPVVSPDTAADPVLVVEPTTQAAPTADPLAVTPDATITPDAAAPVATPRTAQRQRTNTRPVRRARPAPTPDRVSLPVPRADVPSAAPTAVAPIPVVPAAAPLAAAPDAAAPVADVPAPALTEQIATDDMLPIAGAAGLGLIALIGAGAAMRRRKRRAENAEIEAFDEPRFDRSTPAPVDVAPDRHPVMTETAAILPVAASATAVGRKIDAPATKLPEGFDLSRFGPHVQAAYRGPTQDNPSLSLKNRLRRAGAMDQMAGKNVAAPIRATTSQDEGAVKSKVARAKSAEAGFMLGNGKAAPKLNPVLQN